jgi:hypothetical protein
MTRIGFHSRIGSGFGFGRIAFASVLVLAIYPQPFAAGYPGRVSALSRNSLDSAQSIRSDDNFCVTLRLDLEYFKHTKFELKAVEDSRVVPSIHRLPFSSFSPLYLWSPR